MRCNHFRLMIRYILAAVGVTLILVGVVFGQQQPSSTRTHRWHKYVNDRYGFSFWYPDTYERVRLTASEEAGRYAPWKRLLVLARRDDPDARIWIILDVRPFNLSTISQSHAPTGYDPELAPPGKRIGTHVFYGYGPGGGGVQYADQFFVNLRGKTLEFIFDGPYQGKSPNDETRVFEGKILRTFRVRQASR